MQFGALGDIHGDFASVDRILAAHADVPFWVCVGDVADASGAYAPCAAPVHWIKGNNENFDAIAAGDLPVNLHYLPNGRLVTVEGVRIAGLGGTLAPSWYEAPAAGLPHPKKGSARATGLADRRRHLVREEVEACRAMRGVDVFLTHEAPRPYRVSGGRMDMGKTPVNEVLADMRPRLHLFGHHHRLSEQERQGVRSVGLDLVSRSYLLVDARTFDYQIVKQHA
jgi:Icc-related predicted phosphoesterase